MRSRAVPRGTKTVSQPDIHCHWRDCCSDIIETLGDERLQLGFPFSISAESATMSLLRRCSQACPTRALNWASITTGVRGFADASISAEKDDKDIVTQQPQELHADVISGAPSEPSHISLMFSGCSLVLQRNFAIAQCASTNRLGTPCRVDQRRRNVGAWIGTRCRGVGGGRIL
jgi:hypothetical protein